VSHFKVGAGGATEEERTMRIKSAGKFLVVLGAGVSLWTLPAIARDESGMSLFEEMSDYRRLS
jgi:hypothetical protein